MTMLPTDARILKALRQSGHALAVPDLALAAGIPPGELARRVEELRGAGYEIALVPHAGYRLGAGPDRLIADDLRARLEGAALAREIVVFEETGSTNDVAARLARGGAAEGVAVFAERQTAGRGRLGRRWESAAHKGLWFSLLLRPRISVAEWSRLTTWAAVGVARGLEAVSGGAAKAAIKWPNDVYLAGRKSVGILIESAADPVAPYAIAGIGINVNHQPDDFPEGIVATSLREAIGTGDPLDRMAVAATVLRELTALYPVLHDDFPALLAEAEARSLLVGRWVEVRTPMGLMRGMAEGLEPDGGLRLRREEGRLERLSGGEVSVLQW